MTARPWDLAFVCINNHSALALMQLTTVYEISMSLYASRKEEMTEEINNEGKEVKTEGKERREW